jgi:hypothetical protein
MEEGGFYEDSETRVRERVPAAFHDGSEPVGEL